MTVMPTFTDAQGNILNASAIVLIDAVTGLPVTTGSFDTSLLSLETTQQLVLAKLDEGLEETASLGQAPAGDPYWFAGVTQITNPAAVGDGLLNQLGTDGRGRMLITGAPRVLQPWAPLVVTNSTAEQDLIAAGGAGVFLDLVALHLTNTSDTDCEALIRDDTVASGATAASYMVKGKSTAGFGSGVAPLLNQRVANKKWTLVCGTAVTSLKATVIWQIRL